MYALRQHAPTCSSNRLFDYSPLHLVFNLQSCNTHQKCENSKSVRWQLHTKEVLFGVSVNMPIQKFALLSNRFLLSPLAQRHRPNNGMKNNISLHLSLDLCLSLCLAFFVRVQ